MLINQASTDERFRDHPGLTLYGIESYVAVPLNRRDGSYFGTLCALDPQPAALDEDSFAIFHLLAQLIAFELEAEEQQQRREADLRALEDFIAIAGHDLRQPLAVLLGRLQLLARQARRGLLPDDLASQANSLIVQVRRAATLSTVLLDIARMESGGFTIDRAPFDFSALARRLIEEMRVVSPRHSFRLEGPERLRYTGDEQRLEQALRNLLENAAKYAPPESGPIVLTQALTEPPAPGAAPHLVVSVRDAGLGVPDDQLTRIFERQYRTPRAVEEGLSGSGLGLYIVRQIVEAHGGAVEAMPAPGGGLLVRLTLPGLAHAR